MSTAAAGLSAPVGSLDRTAWLAPLHILGALLATVYAPLWLMLLAPLLLGVPHVASDIRYLILRPPRPLQRHLLMGLGGAFAAMTLLRVVSIAGGPSLPRLELSLGALAVATGLFFAAPSLWRYGLGALTAVLWMAGLFAPGTAALAIGHAHNFVALGIWVWWMGANDPRGLRWISVGTLGVAIAVVLAGIGEGLPTQAGGLSAVSLVDTLAPGAPGPWGWRIVRVFALMQMVHYSMWVWCIPAARRSDASWADDFGRLGIAAVVIAAIALPAAGWFAPAAARSSYLGLVLFHGWLEFAIAAHLLVGARGR